ncbi:MAG: hypothetical protein NVSMB57_09280 [Actinomycetota bacterium]
MKSRRAGSWRFPINRSKLAAVLVAISVIAVSAAPSIARRKIEVPKFSTPIKLADFDGGEPSLAIDPSGNGGVYVSAPQSLGSGKLGVAIWASRDHGRTFPTRSQVGSAFGGGDSDVEVGTDHTVYIADLELAANAICRSADGGKTFIDATAGGPCNGVVSSQYGYVSDREWINHGPSGELYLTYHDDHAELPYVYRSDDKGRTFTPCGPDAFSATGRETQAFTPGPTSGTQVPKPVIGPDGSIYVLYATGDPRGSGAFDHLWMSATPKCIPNSIFTSHLVYTDPGSSLAQPFNGIAMDGGGTLYVLVSGHLNANEKTDNVWIFSSKDRGETWSQPIRVSPPRLTANMLPAIAAGRRKGEVAVGWYGSSTGTQRSDKSNVWRYYIATSLDGGAHFAQSAGSPVMHRGPQARALLDFTSLGVEPGSGAVIAAFAGDADGTRRAYVMRQISGPFLR